MLKKKIEIRECDRHLLARKKVLRNLYFVVYKLWTFLNYISLLVTAVKIKCPVH